MGPFWQVQLLGELRVAGGGRVLSRFAFHNVDVLFAFLALHPHRSYPRDELVELLWPEGDLQVGRTNFRHALTVLRRALEPPGSEPRTVLLADRHTVGLNPAAFAVDVVAFETALHEAQRAPASRRPPLLEQALALYPGELLPNYSEQPFLQARATLAERYNRAVQELLALLEAGGERKRAVEWAQRAVEVEPWEEQHHRQLIRLLLATGQEAAARQRGAALEQMRQELGLKPDPGLAHLLGEGQRPGRSPDNIRPTSVPRLAPALSPVPAAAPRALPQPLTRFFGREGELAEIPRLLQERRLITLIGPAGVGKSRLALEAVLRGDPTRRDAAWRVSLAAIADPELLPEAVLAALPVSRSPETDAWEQILAFLAPRPALLLLDNLEHLLPEGALFVQSLLEGVGTLVVLATSRQALGLPGEQEYPVEPLPVPERVPAGVAAGATPAPAPDPVALMTCPSVQIFLDRALLVRPHFGLTAGTAAKVATLCRELEGLPLALELAAASMATKTLPQILRGLEQRFVLLKTGHRVSHPRHQSLRAALDWSYDLLPPDQQRFFRQLAVFRGGWTVEAARAVCQTSDAVEALERLSQCSLLLAGEGAAERRYGMLETLREYAAEKLQETGEEGEAGRRHAAYFRDWAEATAARWAEPEPRRALDRLEAELDNLRAAIDRSATGGDLETALRLVAAPGAFWHMRGHAAEARQQVTLLLARAKAGEFREARAVALDLLAVLEGFYQQDERAHTLALELLALRRDLGERPKLGAALLRVGYAALCCGRYDEAEAHLRQSLTIARELGDRGVVQTTLGVLGAVATQQGNPAAAEAYLEESVAVGRQTGHRSRLAESLLRLGDLAERQGDLTRARSLVEESGAIYQELKDQNGLFGARGHLANLAMDGGDYARARGLLEEQRVAVRAQGGSDLPVLITLGNNALRAGDLDTARDWFRQAQALLPAQEEESRPAAVEFPLAVVALLEGRTGEAAAFFEAALDRSREEGRAGVIAGTAHCLAMVRRRQGDWDAARALLQECLALCRRVQYWLMVPSALEALAEVVLGTGEAGTAARLLGAAAAQRARTGLARPVLEQATYDGYVAGTRAALGQEAFNAAWAAGERLSLMQALTLALDEPS